MNMLKILGMACMLSVSGVYAHTVSDRKMSDEQLAAYEQIKIYVQGNRGQEVAQIYWRSFCGKPPVPQVHAFLAQLNNQKVFNAIIGYFDDAQRCTGLLSLQEINFTNKAYSARIEQLLKKHGLDQGSQQRIYASYDMPQPSAPELESSNIYGQYGQPLSMEQLDQQNSAQVISPDRLPDQLAPETPESKNLLSSRAKLAGALVGMLGVILWLKK